MLISLCATMVAGVLGPMTLEGNVVNKIVAFLYRTVKQREMTPTLPKLPHQLLLPLQQAQLAVRQLQLVVQCQPGRMLVLGLE
jgi:hypothetical protein